MMGAKSSVFVVLVSVGGGIGGLVDRAEADPAASRHVCARTQPDLFDVDGMYDDWAGINRGTGVGDRNPDRAFVVRCAYDDSRLYLLINVRDDKLIRTRKPTPTTEDSVTVKLQVAEGSRPLSIRAFPGARTGPPARTGVPKWVDIEDSLQAKGFSLELAVQLSRLPGFGRSAPSLTAEIAYHDTDKAMDKRIEDSIRFRGRLEFVHGALAHRSLLKAVGASPGDVRLDVTADVDPGEGPERVIAVGKAVGVVSESFAFIELPVASADDVLAVKVVNLSGNGLSQILTHYRQRGDGGASRDLLHVWNVSGTGAFETALVLEVRKTWRDNRLENRWSLVPAGTMRGGAQGKGTDLVVEAQPAVGWDEDSYDAQPAGTGIKPILLPWEDQTSAVWFFQGGVADGGAPIQAPPARRRGKRRRR